MAKKLVNSDFKNHRVEDPTQIDEKQQKKVKKYCKEYFDKAVAKHRAYEHRKNEKSRPGTDRDSKAADTPNGAGASDDELDVKMSDDEGDNNHNDNKETSPTATEGGIKRKRTGTTTEDDAMAATKRQRSSTPPPPPPPPDGEPPNSDDANMSTPAGTDMERPIDTPPPPPPPPSDDRCMTQEERDEEDMSAQIEVGGEV